MSPVSPSVPKDRLQRVMSACVSCPTEDVNQGAVKSWSLQDPEPCAVGVYVHPLSSLSFFPPKHRIFTLPKRCWSGSMSSAFLSRPNEDFKNLCPLVPAAQPSCKRPKAAIHERCDEFSRDRSINSPFTPAELSLYNSPNHFSSKIAGESPDVLFSSL
jgi:hypothetical protein